MTTTIELTVTRTVRHPQTKRKRTWRKRLKAIKQNFSRFFRIGR